MDPVRPVAIDVQEQQPVVQQPTRVVNTKVEDLGLTGSVMLFVGSIFETGGGVLTSRPILSFGKMAITGIEYVESSLISFDSPGKNASDAVTTGLKAAGDTMYNEAARVGMLVGVLIIGILVRKMGTAMKNPENIRWVKTTAHLS